MPVEEGVRKGSHHATELGLGRTSAENMSQSSILRSRVILNLIKARTITMMPEKKMRMRSTTVTRAPWSNLVPVAKAGIESAMSGRSKAIH
jgi:hypothetical protein